MTKRLMFGIASMVFGLFLFFEAGSIEAVWKEPLHPKMYPMVVAGLMVVASVVNIGFAIVDIIRNRKSEAGFSEFGAQENDQGKVKAAPWSVLLLSFLYIMGIQLLGFYSSTLLYTFLLMLLLAHLGNIEQPTKTSVTRYLPFCIALVVVLYLAIEQLRVYLPGGGVLL